MALVATGSLGSEPLSGGVAAPTTQGPLREQGRDGACGSADVAVPTILGCNSCFHNLTEEGIQGQASQVISFLKAME